MEKKYACLERIDNNQRITKENNYAFLYHLQLALLLALREQRILSTMQYRYAEEILNNHRRIRARQKQDER